MATFNARITLGAQISYQAATALVPSPGKGITSFPLDVAIAYTNGSGDRKASKLAIAEVTGGPGTTAFDLTSLTDPDGQTISFAGAGGLKELIIYNQSTTSGETYTISGNIFGAWGDTGDSEIVNPLGVFRRSSPVVGFTVTNTTQDALSIENTGSGSNTFLLIMWG